MIPAELLRLEAIAFHAWPAARVKDHRGMLLRITGGESRRANSAAVFACDPSLAVGEMIAVGEEFYASCGQRAQFQVGPTAPPGLDEALASRGYLREAPVRVQTSALEPVLERARAAPPRAQANIASVPEPAWVEIEIARGRYAAIAATFLDALARLGPRAGFATARVGGAAAAACLFVHDEDFVVLAAMRTLPEARRRGAARALLHAGALWAAERGAARMLLQVEDDNAPALSLYASEGFVTQYGYHYRALVGV